MATQFACLTNAQLKINRQGLIVQIQIIQTLSHQRIAGLVCTVFPPQRNVQLYSQSPKTASQEVKSVDIWGDVQALKAMYFSA